MSFFKWVVYHILWVKEGKPSIRHWVYIVLFKYNKFERYINISPGSFKEWVRYEFEENPYSKIIGPLIREYKRKKYPFYLGAVRFEPKPYKIKVSFKI